MELILMAVHFQQTLHLWILLLQAIIVIGTIATNEKARAYIRRVVNGLFGRGKKRERHA